MIRRWTTLLGALLAWMLCLAGCGGKAEPGSAAADCIHNMLRYSREGRTAEYLDCFEPKLRAKLEGERDAMKAGEFADYLRRRAQPVRGFACSDETVLDENTNRIKVEWVFEDRNEIQLFSLKRIDGVWKIADMTEAQYKKPSVPYGTKVFD